MANQYTKSKINKNAVSDYILKKGSLEEIGKNYNVSRKVMTRWVRQSGYDIYPKKQLDYHDHLFEIIDSEEKAYWLGFIFADGYVSDRYDFEVSLSIKDIKQLEKLGKFMNKEVKTDSFRCRIGIVNKRLVKSLNKYGVVPRKSLILKFPDNLNSEMIPHFIRGYFDGDGCIYLGGNMTKTKSHAISLLGTLDMLQNIEKHFKTNVFYSHDERHHKDCHSFRVTKTKDIVKILDYMYKDSNIYLERKYKNYCRLRQKCLKLLGSNIGEG